MMTNETLLRLQTHAVSATINFVKGLDTEDEDEGTSNNNKILNLYTEQLFTNLINLLKKAIDNSYEPL